MNETGLPGLYSRKCGGFIGRREMGGKPIDEGGPGEGKELERS